MSFRFILSNTARLAPFTYGHRRVQGSAKARCMPARIVEATWIIYLGQSTRTHLSCASTANNEAGEDAFMLNTLIVPCINEYWMLSVVVMKGACQTCAIATGTARTLQSCVIIVYLCQMYLWGGGWRVFHQWVMISIYTVSQMTAIIYIHQHIFQRGGEREGMDMHLAPLHIKRVTINCKFA